MYAVFCPPLHVCTYRFVLGYSNFNSVHSFPFFDTPWGAPKQMQSVNASWTWGAMEISWEFFSVYYRRIKSQVWGGVGSKQISVAGMFGSTPWQPYQSRLFFNVWCKVFQTWNITLPTLSALLAVVPDQRHKTLPQIEIKLWQDLNKHFDDRI